MLAALERLSLLQGLRAEQIDLLESLFELYECPSNTPIFEQGDPAVYLYLILEGEVAIGFKPYDGPPITVTHLTSGDAFGWSAVLGSGQYTSSIISITALEAVRFRGTDLWRLCREQPETGEIILERLAGNVWPRWKNATIQIQSLLDKQLGKP